MIICLINVFKNYLYASSIDVYDSELLFLLNFSSE